eukprot:g5542.t1
MGNNASSSSSVRKENEDDLEYNVRRALERKDWKEVRRLLKQNLGPLRKDLMDSIELFSNDNYLHDNYLHIAAHLGHCGLVRLLIKHGCDVNAVTESTNHTALHEAAYYGHVDIASILVQNGADIDAVDEDKATSLLWTAQRGHVDFVKFLIQNGADVNVVNSHKWSALHFATTQGHLEVVKVLILNGADVDTANETNGIKNWTSLHYAATAGRVEILKLLIQIGADVNAVDAWRNTSLHQAASRGRVDALKLLLENGADVNAVNRNKQTPLDLAVTTKPRMYTTECQPLCFLHLLCYGAKIDDRIILEPTKKRKDETGLLIPIHNGTSFLSYQEREFMWNLAFALVKTHPVIACKAYYTIRSFVMYRNIFMAPAFGLGDYSIWKKKGKWHQYYDLLK